MSRKCYDIIILRLPQFSCNSLHIHKNYYNNFEYTLNSKDQLISSLELFQTSVWQFFENIYDEFSKKNFIFRKSMPTDTIDYKNKVVGNILVLVFLIYR